MANRQLQRSTTFTQFKKHIPFYLLLLLPLIQVIIFNYVPIYGIVIAFKNFKFSRGIMGSEWVGFYWFERVFTDPFFIRVLGNTIRISLMTLVVTFPLPIIFALLINELMRLRFKKIVQTISYMPHFLSWVVMGGIVYRLFSPINGAINSLFVNLGVLNKPVYFMIQPNSFISIYLLSLIWKETGWGTIIYLAAIAGVDTWLYEAASIEGANRFQRVWYITLPTILPTVSTLLILRMGSLISVGFDPIFNLYNPSVYKVADVISTYVYRKGIMDAQYEFTTAVGLFQNVVAFSLVLMSNWIARKANPEYRIM
jgi:putative aldouronate transport system permease protein